MASARDAGGCPLEHLTPDTSLIVVLGDGAYAGEPHRAPYAARFSRGGRTLTFIAGTHELGLERPTMRTTARAFEAASPDAVVVEGVNARNPDQIYLFCRDAPRLVEDHPEGLDEGRHAVWLAGRRSLPCYGSEPDEHDEIAAACASGFDRTDILYFYAFRMVPCWRMQGTLDASDLPVMFDDYLRGYGLDFAGFDAWFRTHRPDGLELAGIQYNDTGPFVGTGATYFHRVCRAIDRYREVCLVLRIGEALNRHPHVLAIFGSGHLVKQRRVWEALLGPSLDAKWF